MSAQKQVVTATIDDGSIFYTNGRRPGSRKMFYVDGRLTVYVKGRVDDRMYERLTLDIMRRMSAKGVPVSELKRASS